MVWKEPGARASDGSRPRWQSKGETRSVLGLYESVQERLDATRQLALVPLCSGQQLDDSRVLAAFIQAVNKKGPQKRPRICRFVTVGQPG